MIEKWIPKLRKGSYFPGFLKPRRTAGKALAAVIQEAYIQAVSTRSVDVWDANRPVIYSSLLLEPRVITCYILSRELHVLRILRYCLAAAMAAFALLQVNDPDPLVWVVAYGLVAFCVAAPPEKIWLVRGVWLTGGVLLMLALGALPGFVDYLLSGDFGSIAAGMGPDQPHVEPAREFLGVLIAALVLIGVRLPGIRMARQSIRE